MVATIFISKVQGAERRNHVYFLLKKIAQDFASLPPSLTLFLFLSSSSHSSLELQFITLSRPLLVNFLRANNLFRQNRGEGFMHTRKIPFNFTSFLFLDLLKPPVSVLTVIYFSYALVSFSMVFVSSLLVCM